MKLIITGANGYIGARLAALAYRQGNEVVSATRKAGLPGYEWLPYDMREDPAPFPDGTKALIHLAVNAASSSALAPDIEVSAAKKLLVRCTDSGTTFVFVSSQTAASNAPTAYGQIKWRIEQDVLAAGGVVIRPGQVYGGDQRGLFGTLTKIVAQLPIIPVLLPKPMVQPIHVDDLVAAILLIVNRDDCRGEIFSLGSITPVSFSEFLMSIARYRLKVRRLPVPAPTMILRGIVRVVGVNLSEKLGIHRILSLTSLPKMQTSASLGRLRLQLRPMSAGMRKSGQEQRRVLIEEGVAMLSYLFKSSPCNGLVRRYVRALENSERNFPVFKSSISMRAPCLVALIDNNGTLKMPGGREFSARLQMAIGIAEASTSGASLFLGLNKKGSFISAGYSLVRAAVQELFWRIFSLLTRSFAAKLMLRSGTKRGT